MRHIRAGQVITQEGRTQGREVMTWNRDNTVRTKIKYRKHRRETDKEKGEHLAGRRDIYLMSN